jgi:hypothetical protein
MLVANKYTLARSSHSVLFIVFLQPMQAREYRRVFFWLILFGAECVVT